MFILPNALIAQDVVPQELLPKEYTKSELKQIVYKYAKQYNVNPNTMISIINCENRNWDVDLQSMLKYKKNNRWGFAEGVREKSYGLAQIHLPDHPDVTYKEAIDPVFSIEFMAKNLNKVYWSCDKRG